MSGQRILRNFKNGGRTWNVRKLNEVIKLENLNNELKKLSLDVIGVRWSEENDFWIGDYKRMLKIKLAEKVRNKKLQKGNLQHDRKKKKVEMIEHNLRHPRMLALIPEVMVQGKN